LFLVSVLVGVGAAVALAGGQTVGTGAVVGGFLILAVPKLLRTTGKSRASEPLYGWARILGFLAGFLAVSTMFAPALVDTWNEYAPSSPASARPVDPLTAEGLRSALDALGTAGFGSRYHELTIDERTVRATVASAGGARQVTFRDGRVTDAPESMTPLGPAHDLETVPVDRIVAIVDRASTRLGVPGGVPTFRTVHIWSGTVSVTVGAAGGNAIITADMTGAIRSEQPYVPGRTSSCTTMTVATGSVTTNPTVFGTQCPDASASAPGSASPRATVPTTSAPPPASRSATPVAPRAS